MNHCVCLGLMILLDNKQLRFWRNLTLTQAWKRDMLHSSLAILSIRLGRTRRTSYPWRNPAFLLVFRPPRDVLFDMYNLFLPRLPPSISTWIITTKLGMLLAFLRAKRSFVYYRQIRQISEAPRRRGCCPIFRSGWLGACLEVCCHRLA
jgi:hypothetical protein